MASSAATARASGPEAGVGALDPPKLKAMISAALAERAPRLGLPPAQRGGRRGLDAGLYAVEGPAGRLRGMLAAAICLDQSNGRASEQAVDVALAVEFLHASSLLLDDLPAMDGVRERRGKPAHHCVYGEAGAMLAALALFNAAFMTLTQVDAPADRRVALVARLGAGVGPDAALAGQARDLGLGAQRSAPVDLEGVLTVHRQKTASVFEAAAALGALAAGAPTAVAAQCSELGRDLGVAYQIADDACDQAEDQGAGRPNLYLAVGPARAAAEGRRRLLAVRRRIAPREGLLAAVLGPALARLDAAFEAPAARRPR